MKTAAINMQEELAKAQETFKKLFERLNEQIAQQFIATENILKEFRSANSKLCNILMTNFINMIEVTSNEMPLSSKDASCKTQAAVRIETEETFDAGNIVEESKCDHSIYIIFAGNGQCNPDQNV